MSSLDPSSQQGPSTFTPTIGDGSNNFVLNGAATAGYYSVIGNMVFYQASINWTSKGSAIAGQNVVIGLPVPCLSAGSAIPIVGTSAFGDLAAGANTIVMGHVQIGTRFAQLDYYNTSTQATGLVLVSMMSAASGLNIQGWYFRAPGALGIAS